MTPGYGTEPELDDWNHSARVESKSEIRLDWLGCRWSLVIIIVGLGIGGGSGSTSGPAHLGKEMGNGRSMGEWTAAVV